MGGGGSTGQLLSREGSARHLQEVRGVCLLSVYVWFLTAGWLEGGGAPCVIELVIAELVVVGSARHLQVLRPLCWWNVWGGGGGVRRMGCTSASKLTDSPHPIAQLHQNGKRGSPGDRTHLSVCLHELVLGHTTRSILCTRCFKHSPCTATCCSTSSLRLPRLTTPTGCCMLWQWLL
jgi:hypothetical protein